MNNLKVALLALLLLMSPLALAEMGLSRSTMENYFAAMRALKPLETKYADAFARMEARTEGMSLSNNGKELAEIIRAQPFAGEIEQLLQANGFTSVEAFSAYSVKLLSGVLIQSFESAKPEMEQAMAQFKAQMQQMKQSGMSPELVAQMEAGMAESQRMLKEYDHAEQNLTPADKAAVAENFAWLEAEFEKLDD